MAVLLKRHFYYSCIYCLAVCFFTGSARSETNLCFHASFGKGIGADTARGNTHPVLADGTQFAKGKIDRGLLVKAGSRLAYETAKHINPGSGTIMMWIKPNSAAVEKDAGFGLIDCGNATDSNNDIYLAYFAKQGALGATFDAMGPAAIQSMQLVPQPNEWHHVALCWDCKKGVRLYFDGKQILNRKVSWKPTPVSPRFAVGDGRGHNHPMLGVLDELTICDRALAEDEVEQFRNRKSGPLPTLAYAAPYAGPLGRPATDATIYMNRQQNEPLAPRPEISDVEHFDIDYDKSRMAAHPQQGVFRYYGNGEIVVGYNRAPCKYEQETDVSHGPSGYHGRAEVVLRRSLDYGRTWPEDQEVIIYRESDPPAKKRAFLFQPDAKREQIDMFSPDSLFFFTRSWLPELKGKMVCACMRSADRGRTWEKAPTVIPNPLIKNGDMLKSSYPVLRMPDGRTLLMVGAMNMPHAPKHSGPVLFSSTHNGLHWKYKGLARSEPKGRVSGRFTYGTLMRMADGELHCYFLHIGDDRKGNTYVVDGVRNAICMTTSRDEGKTWSDPVPITGKGRGCWKNPGPVNVPPGASNYRAPWPIRLADGRILVIFNRRRLPVGIGGIISSDGGKTWSHEFAIRDDGPLGDSGYPVACEFEDGRIFVAYYFTRPDGNKFGGTRYIGGSIFRIK
ncbi:MAG: exo-alpha-sialidase [Pirellulales bacterium]|nr:exo-alpha-sialidase [Pirellulales bacterium]